jgi:hypothetical protein
VLAAKAVSLPNWASAGVYRAMGIAPRPLRAAVAPPPRRLRGRRWMCRKAELRGVGMKARCR